MKTYSTGLSALKNHGAARAKNEGDGEPTIAFADGPGLAAPRGVREVWSPGNDVKAASLSGPRLQIEGSVKEAVQHLLSIAHTVYSVRGVPQMMEFADVAVRSAAAHAKYQTRSEEPDWRFPLRGLDEYLRTAGALPARRGGMTATRATRVAGRMREIRAYDGQGYVASVQPDAEPRVRYTPDPRRALTAYDYFVALNPGFDETLLNSITQAKTTPPGSLRDPRLCMIRRTIPDVGAALLLRALDQEGYKDDRHETPTASLATPEHRLLIWAEYVVLDLRAVLDEKDGKIRGEVYSPQIESPSGGRYTPESYEALVRALEPIEFSNETATKPARDEAERIFRSNQDYYKALKSEYRALQRAIGPRQSAAVAACDLLISYIRHAFDVKLWQRRARGLNSSEGQAGDRRDRRPEAPRAPHPDDFSYQEEAPPPPAAAAAPEPQGEGAEDEGYVVYTIPRFDMSWMEVQESSVRLEVEAHGVAGWRKFRGAEYGETLWRVVAGPMFFALDFEREGVDDQMVVIAPRREGGGGVDTSPPALRVVSLADYVRYFGTAEVAED